MAPLTSVGRLLQVTEVVSTDASFAAFSLRSVASTDASSLRFYGAQFWKNAIGFWGSVQPNTEVPFCRVLAPNSWLLSSLLLQSGQ